MDALSRINEVPRFPLHENPTCPDRLPIPAPRHEETSKGVLDYIRQLEAEQTALKLKVANQKLQLHMQGVAIARRNRRLYSDRMLLQSLRLVLAKIEAAEGTDQEFEGLLFSTLADLINPPRQEPGK